MVIIYFYGKIVFLLIFIRLSNNQFLLFSPISNKSSYKRLEIGNTRIYSVTNYPPPKKINNFTTIPTNDIYIFLSFVLSSIVVEEQPLTHNVPRVIISV